MDNEVHDHDRGLAFDLSTLLTRRRAMLLVAGAGLATIAGCGTGSDGTSAASTSTSTSTSTSGSDSTTGSTRFTGDPDSEWCRTYSQIRDLQDPTAAGSAEHSAELFDQSIALTDHLVEVAPAEIAEASQVAADGLRRLDEVLSRYDYDLTRFQQEAPDEDFEAFDNPELNAASDDLNAYATQVCGIS